MVEYFIEDFRHVYFVFLVVLHVGVPENVRFLIGNDDQLAVRLEQDIEELKVVFVAIVELHLFEGKLIDELVLP